MNLKKLFTFVFIFLSTQFKAYSAEPYIFGGAKVFNYGIETSDLQAINTSLVSLGFSSSTSSTDNTGVGFDFGIGIEVAPNLSIEGGYVNYGTLTINTTLTGPSESVTTDISGNGVTGAVKYHEDAFYVKGGMHSWDFSATVSTSQGSSSDALGSGTDPFFGIGLGTEQMEFGYEYYMLEDGSISALTLRYAHKF